MHRNWQDLITPNNVEIATLTDTYGKFIAKPLERGYGTTLGNSLRRVAIVEYKWRCSCRCTHCWCGS